jgi:putative ABC transport system permease protein
MFKNYFKTTFRILSRNKGYSFLNIFGLAIGIACAGLIFLWVEDEVNWDSFHANKDSLYLVKMNDEVDNGIFTHSSSPGLMAPALQADFPGIANTCRVTEGSTTALFNIANKAVYASGNNAEPSLFSMFTLPFVQGNAKTAFTQLYSIVITEKAAKKFFGGEKSVIGRTVRMDNKQDYVVTGVLKDLPENSSLQFEWLAPFQIIYQHNQGMQRWSNFGTTTYVQLKHGVNVNAINHQLYNYIQQKQGADKSTVHAFLSSMNDWHLRNQFDNGKPTGGGQIQYVHLFSVIAWIILLIACINFMNLATARSEQRAKEVCVRKVLGSDKRRLICQFIGEALFMAFLSAITAVTIIQLALPSFNLLVQKNLSLNLTDPIHLFSLTIIIVICGVIAGSYPSLYLSSFNPVFVLKGVRLKTGSAAFIRKGLVVMQFAVSIILIISTIIIYLQIQHVKSRDLGYNKNNLLELDAQPDVVKNFDAIKQDLRNTNVVSNATLADHTTINAGNNTTAVNWQGKDPNSIIVISQRLVSKEFLSTVGLHLLEGRDFEPTDVVEFNNNHLPKDSNVVFNVIITRSLERLMGKGSAIGKSLEKQNDVGAFHLKVAGVVNDYVYGDMYGQSSPVIFYDIPQAANLMYIRLNREINIENALKRIESVMKKDNPAFPFQYRFVDEEFNNMFLSEMLISRLSRVFAALAIIISYLGLFGLAAYTAERRTKEIGIRKVLGASVASITSLLSIDFIKLVTISCVIAFPVAWWTMHDWLRNYKYRIEIGWWIFLAAGVSAILIALITISFQSLKAAFANPVKSLRSE